MKSVTILSTVKNINNTVDEWLNSLLSQDYPGVYNIVIIDGGSTDGTVEVLKKFARSNKITLVEYNSSQPQAFNYAIKNNLILYDLVALIDGDCIAPKMWLYSLVNKMSDKAVDAVGGPGLTPKNSNILQKLIGLDLDARFLLNSEGLIKRHPNMNLLIKKDILKEIGFNENFIVAYDTYFCSQFSKKGYKLWYSPESFVLHNHRSTIKQYLKQQFLTGKYAMKYYFFKTSNLKGDNINSFTMTLQPLFLGSAIISLMLLLFNDVFIISLIISCYIIFLLFSIDVIKSYKVHKSFNVILLYTIYPLRLISWFLGAMVFMASSLIDYKNFKSQ